MARDHTDPREPLHRSPGGASAPGRTTRPEPDGQRRSFESPSAGELPASMRGPVTLCLAVYLVGLGLCVAGNTASGSSRLVATLKDRFFTPWMVPLWLDLGHDTRLTYGLPEDADHHLELRPLGTTPARPGNGPATATLRFPASGDHSERAARWRRLASAAVIAEEDPGQAGVLTTAIGAGMFGMAGSDDLGIRIVRRVAPDHASAGSPFRDETALEFRVRRRDGDLQLIPVPPAEEVAPLVDATPAGDGGE